MGLTDPYAISVAVLEGTAYIEVAVDAERVDWLVLASEINRTWKHALKYTSAAAHGYVGDGVPRTWTLQRSTYSVDKVTTETFENIVRSLQIIWSRRARTEDEARPELPKTPPGPLKSDDVIKIGELRELLEHFPADGEVWVGTGAGSCSCREVWALNYRWKDGTSDIILDTGEP